MTQSRPYEKEDLFKMKWLHSADLAPDGTAVVYALTEYDAEKDADYTHLWLRRFADPAPQRLTTGQHNNTNPRWSPDGGQIAFLSDRVDEQGQVFVLSADFGEARQLTTFPQGVDGGIAWSPAGTHLAFTAGKERDEPFDPKQPYRLTRAVYRFDAVGYVQRALSDIYVCQLADGVCTQLTNHDAVVANPRWSPDGSRILYNLLLQPQHLVSVFPSLAVVDLAGNDRVVVSSDQFNGLNGSWHPDGQQLVFAGVLADKPIGSKLDLYVRALDGDKLENRTPTLPMGVCGGISADMPAKLLRALPQIIISADGTVAYVEVQRGGTVEIGRVALQGDESYEPVLAGNRRHKLLAVRQDEREIFYAAGDINQPLELYLSDSEGEHERRVTGHNDALLAGIASARVDQLRYKSIDDVEVEGWLVMPENGTAPFPTILYIHGGPHSAYGHQFRFDTQMLVGAGYAVLLVNHRASTGYGDAFSTAIKGDWGHLDYQDLMHGVDAAIARGLSDPDRLGVCGLSGGGNLSCWIVGHTDRFKAAVPENPVTNWLSFYGTSDIGVWFALEELGGHPHEIPEIYAKCSPITYAHRCTTPTLLVQGEHDWRCPAEQSEQFYTVLKTNGCEVEMLRLPSSPHGGSIDGAPAIRRAQNDALLDWMARHV